jgi:hypothetical protein
MLARKWLLLLVLPLLAGMAIACGGGSKSGGSDQGIKIEQTNASAAVGLTPGGPPPTLAAAPTLAGPLASADEVASLAGNFGKVKSFKATISQTGGASASLQGTIEYSQPDRIRVTIQTSAGTQEIICIGNDFYVKSAGTTAWQKIPAAQTTGTQCRGNLGPADPQQLAKGINEAAADKTLVKGSMETVSGKRCQIYAQSIPNGAHFEMCVADGLPVRIVSKNPPPPPPGQQQSVTIVFSDIDKPIDIKAPV